MNHTALHSSHLKLGAKMMAFAGWHMPFSYKNPSEEHLNVRKYGGLFDVSHMGEIRVTGPNSLSFLESLVPSAVYNLSEGESQYSFLCNEQGKLLDDLIIYCLKKGRDYLLCVNASKVNQDRKWLESYALQQKDVQIQDQSDLWGMIAVQGPAAIELCKDVFSGIDFGSVKKFNFVFQNECLFSRTGYTGEDGFEIYIPWEKSSFYWNLLVKKGSQLCILPVGLGARDTLRLEMAYLLSGQDFNETHTPLEAGLYKFMKNPKNYVGKRFIELQKKQRIQRQITGFILEEPIGIPRAGYPLLSKTGETIGVVTSGAKSPSLEKMIGLAYIKGQETDCFLKLRGSKVKVHLVSGPFLKRRLKDE